jgi:hypothetical protein
MPCIVCRSALGHGTQLPRCDLPMATSHVSSSCVLHPAAGPSAPAMPPPPARPAAEAAAPRGPRRSLAPTFSAPQRPSTAGSTHAPGALLRASSPQPHHLCYCCSPHTAVTDAAAANTKPLRAAGELSYPLEQRPSTARAAAVYQPELAPAPESERGSVSSRDSRRPRKSIAAAPMRVAAGQLDPAEEFIASLPGGGEGLVQLGWLWLCHPVPSQVTAGQFCVS